MSSCFSSSIQRDMVMFLGVTAASKTHFTSYSAISVQVMSKQPGKAIVSLRICFGMAWDPASSATAQQSAARRASSQSWLWCSLRTCSGKAWSQASSFTVPRSAHANGQAAGMSLVLLEVMQRNCLETGIHSGAWPARASTFRPLGHLACCIKWSCNSLHVTQPFASSASGHCIPLLELRVSPSYIGFILLGMRLASLIPLHTLHGRCFPGGYFATCSCYCSSMAWSPIYHIHCSKCAALQTASPSTGAVTQPALVQSVRPSVCITRCR